MADNNGEKKKKNEPLTLSERPLQNYVIWSGIYTFGYVEVTVYVDIYIDPVFVPV